jgi:hypothetical protein
MDLDAFIAKYKIKGTQEEELRAIVDEAVALGYDEGYEECRTDIEDGVENEDGEEYDDDWDEEDFDDEDEIAEDELFDDED